MTDQFTDRRAHKRIDEIVEKQNHFENTFNGHLAAHVRFEENLAENTLLTKQIADNTSEIVSIVKGAKGFRKMIVWLSPILVAVLAVYEWIRSH